MFHVLAGGGAGRSLRELLVQFPFEERNLAPKEIIQM